MTSNLYKQAIADAKKLREIAEQNAKNAIVEAVTPKIREFIDSQLLGDNNAGLENDHSAESIIAESLGIQDSDNDYVNLDNSALSALANLIGADSKNPSVLDALAESVNSMDSDSAKLIGSAAKKISHNSDNFKSSKINNVMSDTRENSKMGLNLSRGKPIKYYSSDRIAQLVGNGLLTFIDKNTHLDDFFSNDEIIFYKNINDLSYKLNKYKKDKKIGKKIAERGRNKYLKYFNSEIISDFILSKTFDLKSKNKFIWDKN